MKAAFAEKTPIDLAVILGRLNSVLQPLNVSLNKGMNRNDGNGRQNPIHANFQFWFAVAITEPITSHWD